jgi:hypothetical protein
LTGHSKAALKVVVVADHPQGARQLDSANLVHLTRVRDANNRRSTRARQTPRLDQASLEARPGQELKVIDDGLAVEDQYLQLGVAKQGTEGVAAHIEEPSLLGARERAPFVRRREWE